MNLSYFCNYIYIRYNEIKLIRLNVTAQDEFPMQSILIPHISANNQHKKWLNEYCLIYQEEMDDMQERKIDF